MQMTKEAKQNNFKRIATKRVNKILEDIDSLKNLKNRSFYDFERADLRKIVQALNEAVESLKTAYFETKYKSQFKL